MRRTFVLLCILLGPACGSGGGGGGPAPVVFNGLGVPATPKPYAGGIPSGLPTRVGLGLGNFDLAWVNANGVAMDYRYQYLSGGVNTGAGWTTWNNPPGEFAALYMTASDGKNMIPVFDYYQLRESRPNQGSENPHSKLQTPSTMYAYYAEFKLLLQKCAAFNKTVILHVEPDFWGFVQKDAAGKPENIAVAVEVSGFPEAAGLLDNLCGFAQLLVKLRNSIAPKALIAFHASHWGTGTDLIANNGNPTTIGTQTGDFFNALGADFELLFHDPTDRDAGFKQYEWGDGGGSWWDNTDFNNYRTYLDTVKTVSGRRGFLWQLPLGNTKMKTCDNTRWHYQDNRVEYWLDDTPHANISAYKGAGILGYLWGPTENYTTHYTDANTDGVTNGGATGTTSTVSDDDGGYWRLRAAAYYSTTSGNPGPILLP